MGELTIIVTKQLTIIVSKIILVKLKLINIPLVGRLAFRVFFEDIDFLADKSSIYYIELEDWRWMACSVLFSMEY